MKKLMILSTILFTQLSFATLQKSEIKELCSIELQEEQQTIKTLKTIELKKLKHLDGFFFDLVAEYVKQWTDSDIVPKTFSEAKAILKDEDSYLVIYQSPSTGNKFYQVLAYPGDNANGIFFDKRGKNIGSNGDDSIDLNFDDQNINCYEINNGKTK
jgi:hypothetical protein